MASVLMMLSLGLYFSALMYLDWQDQQVFTKIQTSAHLLKDIEFPSVTFCNRGNNEIITNATLIKRFYTYLSEKYNFNLSIPILTVAELINLSVCSDWEINLGNNSIYFYLYWNFKLQWKYFFYHCFPRHCLINQFYVCL